MSLDKCHVILIIIIEIISTTSPKIPSCLFEVTFHPSPCWILSTADLLSITIVLSFLDFHIYGIIQYVVFCVWLLSHGIMLSRFIMLSTSIVYYFQCGVFFLCMKYHISFIFSTVHGHLDCFQFFVIMNKATTTNHIETFM